MSAVTSIVDEELMVLKSQDNDMFAEGKLL